MNEKAKELCHAMTSAQKKAYNAEYYRNHKNYWEDYYSKGRTVGRPMARQKYVTEGNGQGVHRRGEGLGTGPVGRKSNGGRSVDSTGAVDAWANLVSQTGSPMQSYAYNQAVGIENQGSLPPMTYDDLEQYLSSMIFDNAVNAAYAAAKGAKSAGKKIAQQLVTDWKVGTKAISSLFKKKKK